MIAFPPDGLSEEGSSGISDFSDTDRKGFAVKDLYKVVLYDFEEPYFSMTRVFGNEDDAMSYYVDCCADVELCEVFEVSIQVLVDDEWLALSC